MGKIILNQTKLKQIWIQRENTFDKSGKNNIKLRSNEI